MKEIQHNLYSRGNSYKEVNAKVCAEAMAANNWDKPIWLTQNQIDNANGKYAFNGVRIKSSETPQVTIIKQDHNYPGMVIKTKVYNIDQTNMSVVAPGAYELFSQGKTFDEVSDILMHQPLLTRAMQTGEQTPTSFWKRIAAVF